MYNIILYPHTPINNPLDLFINLPSEIAITKINNTQITPFFTFHSTFENLIKYLNPLHNTNIYTIETTTPTDTININIQYH